MKTGMCIELKDLQLFGNHGWHTQEALTGNEFKVHISAYFIPQVDVITSIDETVSYATIYQIAKEEFNTPRQLLETCAMQMGEQIHQHFPQLESIQISIYKMSAPIPNFSGSVGITYRKDFTNTAL